MGIWDVTKRMIQGKPAFEAPQNSGDDWDDDAPTTDFAEERQQKRDDATSTSLVDENGYKQIPPAALTDVDYKLLGDRFELWATVSNQSDRPVQPETRIILCGLPKAALSAHTQDINLYRRSERWTYQLTT